MENRILEELNFEQIIPSIEEWPIAKFSNSRSNFAFNLTSSVVEKLMQKSSEEILEVLEKTVYLEKRRVKNKPWKVDPSDEKAFWDGIQETLNNKNVGENKAFYEHLLKKIVNRYAEEILGHFNPKTHQFARKFLYRFFNVIFNKSFVFASIKSNKLKKKLKLSGHVEAVRNLYDKGTVVLVPTHYSNLDSIFIGFIMDYLAGVPSSSYGAGLNLFDYEIPAYYMNRLGAYKIDRRKNNPIYRTTLLEMSSKSLQEGVNSLFFPGGGRSRNGGIEEKLKMGLLSSLIDAQIELIKNKSSKKIYVVPVTFGYHFVLEAQSLIEEYLKSEGRSKYVRIKTKKKKNYFKMIKKLYTRESEAYVRVGQPMDILGFNINDDGRSIDGNGEPVNLKGFFEDDGEVSNNKQRESIYTQKLAKKITDSYLINNVVLSSHLIAYVGFKELEKSHSESDLFSLVNTPVKDFTISYATFLQKVEAYRYVLLEMESEDKLKLEPVFYSSTDELIEKGFQSLGIYHDEKPLSLDNSKKYIKSENFKLLFYYHNKLKAYNLKIID